MRWVLFILLLLACLFSLRDLAPLVAGQSGSTVLALVSLTAGLFFLAALAGVFWPAVSIRSWTALVVVAVAASLPLLVLHFAGRMVAPILVDIALLWGIFTKRWSTAVFRMRHVQNVATTVHPLMRVPVPWVFVLVYLAGVGLQALIPLKVIPASMPFFGRVAGAAIAVAGAVLAFSSLGIFLSSRTTTVPFEAPKRLITWGPYRFTRNPMYLGLSVVYVGVAGLYGHWGPILVLPALVFYIHRMVIPVEETRLREVFGNAYDQYTARARRWI